jgi:hypothetical protein
MFCDRLIECLHLGIVNELIFLFRCGIRLIGVFASFEGLYDAKGVEFGELDAPSYLRVGTPN